MVELDLESELLHELAGLEPRNPESESMFSEADIKAQVGERGSEPVTWAEYVRGTGVVMKAFADATKAEFQKLEAKIADLTSRLEVIEKSANKGGRP